VAQTLPPGPDGFHGELGCVAAHADTYPGFVTAQIVDSVGNGLPFRGLGKS
jgi:hypothetical protein